MRHTRVFLCSGEGGIRTLGTREGTPVFETGTFGHSVTSPNYRQRVTLIHGRVRRVFSTIADFHEPGTPAKKSISFYSGTHNSVSSGKAPSRRFGGFRRAFLRGSK